MVRVIPPKPKKKITQLFIILLSVVITFHVFGLTKASAEFVPYDIPVFEREILGSEQYTDYEENKTFIKYNYVGQEVETEHKENIISVNTEKLQDNKYKIYSGNQFIFTNNDWHYLETATTTIENFNELTTEKISLLNWINPFSAIPVTAQTNYYTSYDGYIYENNSSHTLARDATTGTASQQSTTYSYISYRARTTAPAYQVGRINLAFDLSSISETISSASLKVYRYTSPTCDFDNYINITNATIPDTSSITTADFDEIEDTAFSNNLQCSTLNAGYNTFSYNASGINQINNDKGDEHQLWIRHNYDITDTDPGVSGDRIDLIGFYTNEQTGTSYDPYLEITLEEEEETATSTTSTIIPGDLPFLDDITIITGLTEHYETSTTSPDYFEMHYYRIPFIGFLVFAFIFLYIGSRVLLELIIRWRK